MWRIFDKIRRTPLATDMLEQPAAGACTFPELLGTGDLAPAIRACPSGALTESGLDIGKCHACRACVEAAPEAVAPGTRYAVAARRRAELVSAADRGEDPEALAAEIRAILGRSVHIRHVDAGSCNACDWEMTHLLGPVYDLQRFGVDFVASPRHADMLLVTGGVTRHLEMALRRTFEATGDPKLVVAVGTCSISGGLYGQTYAQRGGVDRVVPVTVYVPGCPPRPEAILRGILTAVGRAHELAGVAQ